MTNHNGNPWITRRELLRVSATGTAALASNLVVPQLLAQDKPPQEMTPAVTPAGNNQYAEVLKIWCDGLLAHQVTAIQDDALQGALLCPACTLIHGRCGDALYPLLCAAHSTGDAKYLRAALAVHSWTERQVSRADGSWVNDVTLSSWKGITVFHSIALAEALHHHGSLLDVATRRQWTDRLGRAAKFLDGFISIETGNINYPVTSSYAFALCGQVLGESRYVDRGRALAHTALDYFTPNGLLFGEGHPLKEHSPKGCWPVDLGYNVEESLPALALYSLLTKDTLVLEQTVKALKAHMEFMLPDGAWDNSWGTRNYKWTWWGSRTSDGCHPAYALLSDHDPRFAEAARRNLELMASCTHNGLLYGGPDYFAHGDQPCIHHTFTHAKALATVLDRGVTMTQPAAKASLPRDEAYGVKTFPEIATSLVAIGPWRATVTDYDWEYVEHVQAGGGAGAGHASGGALSLLYHQSLGPILAASMTEYAMIEISNQQAFTDAPHLTLTPRIEARADRSYTNLNDLQAVVKKNASQDEVIFEARGRLLSSAHKPLPDGDVQYQLTYKLTGGAVEITATANGVTKAPIELIIPVVSRSGEAVEQRDTAVRVIKQAGVLSVTSITKQNFAQLPKERTFNLIPGFECIPLTVTMQPGEKVQVRLELVHA